MLYQALAAALFILTASCSMNTGSLGASFFPSIKGEQPEVIDVKFDYQARGKHKSKQLSLVYHDKGAFRFSGDYIIKENHCYLGLVCNMEKAEGAAFANGRMTIAIPKWGECKLPFHDGNKYQVEIDLAKDSGDSDACKITINNTALAGITPLLEVGQSKYPRNISNQQGASASLYLKSSCFAENDFYQIRTLNFQGQIATILNNVYSDSACSKILIKQSHTFKIVNDTILGNENRRIELKLTDINPNLSDRFLVNRRITDKTCGTANWSLGQSTTHLRSCYSDSTSKNLSLELEVFLGSYTVTSEGFEKNNLSESLDLPEAGLSNGENYSI